MIVGASNSVDGVSCHLTCCMGRFSQKELWTRFSSKTLNTQSLTLFSCEQNLIKEA